MSGGLTALLVLLMIGLAFLIWLHLASGGVAPVSARSDRAARALQRATDRYARARESVDRAKAVVVKKREAASRAWKVLSRAKVRVAYAGD